MKIRVVDDSLKKREPPAPIIPLIHRIDDDNVLACLHCWTFGSFSIHSPVPGYSSLVLQNDSWSCSVEIPDIHSLTVAKLRCSRSASNLSTVLASVLDEWRVELDALAHLSSLRETISRATKGTEAKAHAHINVYGTREAGEHVGNLLSTKKIWLQRPDQLRPDPVYDHRENPHVVSFPEVEDQSTFHDRQQTGSNQDLGNSKSFDQVISDVFSSLTRGSHLKCIQGDGRLRIAITVSLPSLHDVS